MCDSKALIESAVEKAGGLTKLAVAINAEIDLLNLNIPARRHIRHTYSQQISNWINRDNGIAPTHVVAFSQATGISCHDLRPDIFPAPANDPTNSPSIA